MELAQYYTPITFSSLLIRNMLSTKAECVLDIGCGQASLLEAARGRWSNAKLIGYDIDPINYNLTGKNLHIGFGNGLDPDLSSKILNSFGNIDVSVANPPYTNVDVNSDIVRILKLAELHDCLPRNLKKLPAEIIFLAQNLLVLKSEGELGAILPASLISGEKWKGLREFLITEKTIDKVIQLPNKAFNKAEAATFAVNFTNRKPNNNAIKLLTFDNNEALQISDKSGIKRLDYFYHAHKEFSNRSPIPKEAIIFRGNKSSKELKSGTSEYIHTSDLKETFQVLRFGYSKYPLGTKTAKKGDFVVSRVGSRCIGKAAFINEGEVEVSDCITVLRDFDTKKYTPLFATGKFYEKTSYIALGTGAKYLTFDIIKEALETNEF
ncbi:N-6 DNA methylase [Thalassomonas haliotis]|uniref:site-specific DNA-methyltransferase (adenine-specific) n=1 Tax=Thalassomonas haliotis TaxID=485448 RepID=A0ABY7VEB8_9GAMM|nr:N-6 DNA methylase [Thalassomonas haliotis]WDE12033.1 N-6 DNA methylase [Thalassomonas haliotis]